MKNIVNPFIIKGYISKEYFCDRKNELETLYRNVENGSNTTIISPRKMGKSGLIFRFFDDLTTEIQSVYVDIYASRTLNDFIKLIAEAILLKFPEKSKIGKEFMKFLKGLRPLITFNPFTGVPQLQIEYQTSQEVTYTLQGLFTFLEEQNTPIVIAIDEFQQINEYPEKNVEALLRTYIQPLKNIQFIFCGSNKSMMTEMFTHANRPFFASTRLLYLEKINSVEYKMFIKNHFEINKKNIHDDALTLILNWTKSHTFYTQNLCNYIFSMKTNNIDIEVIKSAMAGILKENESFFFQYRQLLTPAQWNYLIAIAKENEISQITAQKFISKYNIGTPANSRRIIKSLIDKELVLENMSKDNSVYQIYDVFLSRWLEVKY
ncbi:MAG: ATP-binding protein [Bacteroidetes bacterium]|nr:ATP-binding protein [Bacteroidota bacterium]MCL1968025.1 ATP-binding protein [Bacteroidota bacterium]